MLSVNHLRSLSALLAHLLPKLQVVRIKPNESMVEFGPLQSVDLKVNYFVDLDGYTR